MDRERIKADDAGGFVLVLGLVILVILTILATTVATLAQAARDNQLQRLDEASASVDIESTRATALYMLLTQRVTFGGLTVDGQMVLSEDERAIAGPGESPFSYMPVGNEVALDGTPYRGVGRAFFAIQDDAGRLSVNWAPQILLERFLGIGSADPVPYVTLRNRLLDYQDRDDLKRLNSLERKDYLDAGLPPPTNRVMLTPLELRRIPGWRERLDPADDRVLRALSVQRQILVNVNTAPAEVVAALPGLDAATAARVVDIRRSQPFLSVSAFQQTSGSTLADENYVGLYPSASGTLAVWVPGRGPVRTTHWMLTPRDDGGQPWHETYELYVSAADEEPLGMARTPATPLFAEPVADQQ